MKKITREQWKQWGKWRREGAAAKKACYRAMLTQKLPKDFVFDPGAVRLEFGGFTAPKALGIVADCYQADNTTEEEKEKQA